MRQIVKHKAAMPKLVDVQRINNRKNFEEGFEEQMQEDKIKSNEGMAVNDDIVTWGLKVKQ